MKNFHLKLVIILGVVIGLLVCPVVMATAGDFVPKAGEYYVKKIQGVTFHTYTTPIPMGASASVVIETPNALVLQDVQQFEANSTDLQALISSLGKPLQRIYISHSHDHHWIGLETFPGVPVYANADTTSAMKEKGAEMLAAAKQQFGADKIPYTKVVVPENEIKAGTEIIDTVTFVFSTPLIDLTGPVVFIEFPDQKVLIHHHLAYNGVHVPMPPPMARVAALEELKKKGYVYLIAGHGIPTGSEAFYEATIGYFTKLDEVVKTSADPAAAKAKMIAAYPTWGGVFLLDAILPAHYK